MEKKDILANIPNEVMLVGSLFKDTNLLVQHEKYINPEDDFLDEACKFYYDFIYTYYKLGYQGVDRGKMNIFAMQDKERQRIYNLYGGWKTIECWISVADTDNFKAYFQTMKKHTLLRELDKKGYDVNIIVEQKNFGTIEPSEIFKNVKVEIDKIGSKIMSIENSINANNISENLDNWLIKPSMGTTIPFPLINAMFRGMRKGKFICLGFLSNEGKTRLAIYIAAYIAFIEGKEVAFFANETDEDDFKACLLTTVINNKCFQKCHGIEITKVERQIVLGQYLDDNGNFVSRKTNEKQEFIETEEEYKNRLIKTSTEFRSVLKVTEWLEKQKTIHYKFMRDYKDESIEFEIRKHKLAHGIDHFIYDTMKGWKDENWSVLKQTATKLSTLMLELKTFMWADIQLTDSSLNDDVFELSSNNIANAKQLKHVIDHLLLGKRISKDEYHRYCYKKYDKEWGGIREASLDPSKIYYGIKCDKNRGGDKSKLSLLEVDLNRNTWTELGELKKATRR